MNKIVSLSFLLFMTNHIHAEAHLDSCSHHPSPETRLTCTKAMPDDAAHKQNSKKTSLISLLQNKKTTLPAFIDAAIELGHLEIDQNFASDPVQAIKFLALTARNKKIDRSFRIKALEAWGNFLSDNTIVRKRLLSMTQSPKFSAQHKLEAALAWGNLLSKEPERVYSDETLENKRKAEKNSEIMAQVKVLSDLALHTKDLSVKIHAAAAWYSSTHTQESVHILSSIALGSHPNYASNKEAARILLTLAGDLNTSEADRLESINL